MHGSAPRPGMDAAAAAAAVSSRSSFPSLSSTSATAHLFNPVRAPHATLQIHSDGRGETELRMRTNDRSSGVGGIGAAGRSRFYVAPATPPSGSSRIQVISPTEDAQAADPAAEAMSDVAPPAPLPQRSPPSAFDPSAAAAAAGRHSSAMAAAAPAQSASSHNVLSSDVIGDSSSLLESAASEEVSSLEGCKLADLRSLETCTKRLQQLVNRWKQQLQQTSARGVDATAAPQLKRDCARIWQWLSANKTKLAKAKDLHAAIRCVAADLFWLHLCAQHAKPFEAMEAQEFFTLLQLYTKAAESIVDAKDHPADCATTLGARSSVLSGVDASSYLRDADTTVHRMASRGLPTDAKLHCALLFAQSAHEWSKGELVSSREKLYHAFSSILIKPDNRVELKEKAMDMQRTCERRAEELKKQKERWQLALEFFELSIRVLDLYPGQHPKRNFTVLYNLGDLHVRLSRLHDAIGTFTKALTFQPASLDARAALTHLLFRTGQLRRGRQELKTVLATNLCDYKTGLDLVDSCVDLLDFSDPRHDDEGRNEMLNTIKEAYGLLTNRWKNEDKTVLSLFRAMTKHGFLAVALTHIDDVWQMQSLSSETVDAMREIVWSIAMDLFVQGEYESSMQWLQRYTKQAPVDDASHSIRTLRAMALVAFQMGEYATCIANAKEARRRSASEAVNLGGSLHLPSLIIVRASINMNAMDQAGTELSQLESKTAEMGPELLYILSLICSELQQLGTHPELHTLSLELLLSVQERAESRKDVAELDGAQRLNLTSGLALEQHVFSRLKILGDLIALHTEQYNSIREAIAATKKGARAASATAAAAASSSDDSQMSDDGDASESALLAVERKLADAFQKVAAVLSNPREEEETAKAKDGISSSDSEEEEKTPAVKGETKWFAVQAWNMGARTTVPQLKQQFFVASALLYGCIPGHSDESKALASFARIHAAFAILDQEASLYVAQHVLDAASVEGLLDEAQATLMSLREKSLPALDKLIGDHVHALRLLPVLLVKVQVARGSTDAEIMDYIKNLASTRVSSALTSHEWSLLSAWLQRSKLGGSSSACLAHAIRLADTTDVKNRASLLRKLLTNTPQAQLGQILGDIDTWLKELNAMRGFKGQLHKKYPPAEAEWLINFCWNQGALYYRSRVLSESEKFLKRAFELWDLLMAPTATNRATMRTGMQAQIAHVSSSLEATKLSERANSLTTDGAAAAAAGGAARGGGATR